MLTSNLYFSLQAPSKKVGKKSTTAAPPKKGAASSSGPGKVAKVSSRTYTNSSKSSSRFPSDHSLFSRCTRPGRLEGRLQEEAGWSFGHDPSQHNLQRSHQRELEEEVREQGDLREFQHRSSRWCSFMEVGEGRDGVSETRRAWDEGQQADVLSSLLLCISADLHRSRTHLGQPFQR